MEELDDQVSPASQYAVEEWLSPEEDVAYRDYWEDEAEERRKPYWVIDGDFGPLERYLCESGRVRQVEQVVRLARERFGFALRGEGCDLGSGVAWAAPQLFRLGDIERLWCVEYSRQRLLKIAPILLAHYGVPHDRVVLAHGDFNRVRLPDASLDFVFMCAAFHHSDEPLGLLAQSRRLLRPGGAVLITGELPRELGPARYAKHFGAWGLSRAPRGLQMRLVGREVRRGLLWPSHEALLAPDDQLGDHYYTPSQYEAFFGRAGFDSAHAVDSSTREWSFALVPR